MIINITKSGNHQSKIISELIAKHQEFKIIRKCQVRKFKLSRLSKIFYVNIKETSQVCIRNYQDYQIRKFKIQRKHHNHMKIFKVSGSCQK